MNKLLIIFLCFYTLNISAQQENKDFFKNKKIAIISNEMILSVNEAQQFWPLYNEKNNLISELNKKINIIKTELKSNESNKKYNNNVDKLFDLKFQIAQTEKEYYTKYKKIISHQQIYKLYIGEKKFTSYLLKKLTKKEETN